MLKSIQDRLNAISVPIRKISAEEAAQESKKNNGLMIDVREPAEVENSPTPGTVNIPRGVLEMQMLEKEKDASRPIYVHCASGVRAQLAAEQLSLMGYENVTVLTCDVPKIQAALS
ncbi:rhodanese-like domain-containing protein [Alteromonas antoniana]|uniref:rhodanese-like domain-containing protein n=1 Tax=Alteromonas antoniana TaxID=2803813 RepID=UPI001C459536|nr:rhodanese-like domain-containing protein [Alteromonas antoniana]